MQALQSRYESYVLVEQGQAGPDGVVAEGMVGAVRDVGRVELRYADSLIASRVLVYDGMLAVSK